MSFTVSEPHEKSFSSFKFRHYLQECTSGKKSLLVYAEQPMKILEHRPQTKNPIELKDNSNDITNICILSNLCSISTVLASIKASSSSHLHAYWNF